MAAALGPALLLLAGCGGDAVRARSANTTFSIAPNARAIDTNCTGCNTIGASGGSVEQFTAKLTNGGAAAVTWSVVGGDPVSGAGRISSSGEYTPPSYLTRDRVEVAVTATGGMGTKATAMLTITPGFLQPLTPENLALGAGGTVTITGILAEAGGTAGMRFALAKTPAGEGEGEGSLGEVHCHRGSKAFTSCAVTYSAPPTVAANNATYVVAMAGEAKVSAAVLVNAAGVASNPATHQGQFPWPTALGSSGGNNGDFDTQGNRVVDCCAGTLGALIEDNANRRYLLSNNHVLARSDHAGVGDAIVAPGLIDNNCTPFGDGPGAIPVASLSGWLPLSSKSTNVDAAIARVASTAVDPGGSILELGGRQADGTLAAAPPGISSSGGKGEAATLALMVAKSGRTTGLTCANVSALDLDVKVDYYLDCAETRPYETKMFSHQLAISGNQFSDAGDSGALVVDAGNAEPVGLLFAGGIDASGVSQAVANPASSVLQELGAQAGGGTSYTFVGGPDHAVSCLSYGDSTVAAAEGRTLSDAEIARTQQALAQARMLVNPSVGILGVATGKSIDNPGEGAVILYVDERMTVNGPATVDGVRTQIIPTTAHAVAVGSAPQTPIEAGAAGALAPSALVQAQAVKNQAAQELMRQNPAFFGVGVGQSLDNPREAALIVYVERRNRPAQLAPTIGGLRARYVVMDRLHVTRSYAAPFQTTNHCLPHPPAPAVY